MTTPMYPINSSQISYIGYEKDTKELYITFKNGTTFKYEDVLELIYDNLMKSDFKGNILIYLLKVFIRVLKLNKL